MFQLKKKSDNEFEGIYKSIDPKGGQMDKEVVVFVNIRIRPSAIASTKTARASSENPYSVCTAANRSEVQTRPRRGCKCRTDVSASGENGRVGGSRSWLAHLAYPAYRSAATSSTAAPWSGMACGASSAGRGSCTATGATKR